TSFVTFKATGSSTTSSATVIIPITNVAPTANLGGATLGEGQSATVTFNGASDPSADDTLTGFLYSYDFDNNGSFEVSNSTQSSAAVPAQLTADGPGSFTVHGRIADKDGGFTDYTTTVTVTNVAPVATFGNNGPAAEGSTATVSFANQS